MSESIGFSGGLDKIWEKKGELNMTFMFCHEQLNVYRLDNTGRKTGAGNATKSTVLDLFSFRYTFDIRGTSQTTYLWFERD